MTAKLLTIMIDSKTEDYLRGEMSRNEADQEALAQLNAFGDLTDTPVWLNNLPEGDYTLMISADLKAGTTAHMHLMRDDNAEVMHTVTLELMPIIRSALEDAPEYAELKTVNSIDDIDDDSGLQERFNAQTDALNLRRAGYLEGLFAPFIEHDKDFNIELLDMLDFVAYPLISGSVDLDLDLDEDEDDLPLYTPPHRTTGNKFTLH